MNNKTDTIRAVGIIPARYGSTRLPGKPLLRIGGKPMIQWVYENAARCRRLEEVIVATDDARICAAVTGFGGKCRLTSKLHPSGTDRVEEIARTLPQDIGIIANIQGDEPLLSPELIDEAIAEATGSIHDVGLKPCGTGYAVTLCTRIIAEEEKDDPNVVKVVLDREGFALYFSRSRIPYEKESGRLEIYKHIGLYVYPKAILHRVVENGPVALEQTEKLEQLRLLYLGYRIKVIETDCFLHSVDVESDIKIVEGRLRQ